MVLNRYDAVAEQERIRRQWFRMFSFWNNLNDGLVALTLLASTTVAANPKFMDLSSNSREGLAWLVAVLTGVNALYKPSEKAARFRRAWSLLTIMLARYKADPTYTLDHVLSAYEQGEGIIHEMPAPQPHKPSAARAAGGSGAASPDNC
jgi:hypothetical protein